MQSLMRNNLKRLMADHGLNGTELAIGAGVSQSTVTRYLSGESGTMTFESISALAHYFRLTVSELTGETPSVNSPEEREMIGLMRHMSPQARAAMLAGARVLQMAHQPPRIWCVNFNRE